MPKRSEMKLVSIAEAHAAFGMHAAVVGNFVVVPGHFPAQVNVASTLEGLFAYSNGWEGDICRVFPDFNPEVAWEKWEMNMSL